MNWFLLLASYLLGAIPTSFIAGRIVAGIDLRRHGSGNLGASNAWRVLGARVAVPVLAVDLLKGFIPPALFTYLMGAGSDWALAWGAAAIAGHVFPVYVGFRGGKGVATSAGVFLALTPVALVAAALAWGLVLYATRIVSVASISAAGLFPLAVWLSHGPGRFLWVSVGIAGFIVLAHRSNIRRLLRGEEPAFRRAGAAGP